MYINGSTVHIVAIVSNLLRILEKKEITSKAGKQRIYVIESMGCLFSELIFFTLQFHVELNLSALLARVFCSFI